MTDLSEQAVDLDEVLGGESVAPASQSLSGVPQSGVRQAR